MEVKINKEIRNYTESIVFGLSFRQCIYSAIACIVAIMVYFTFIDELGMEVTSWICIIGALPFAALGFITYQEMNAEKLVSVIIRSFFLSAQELIDKPLNSYHSAVKCCIEKNIKEDLKNYDKKSFKIKKAK